MKYLTFIVTLSSFLVASVLLVIALASCAPNSDAEIQAEWIHIDGTETLEQVLALETDEFRLYAGTSNGMYIPMDHGYTWHSTERKHYGFNTIAIRESSVYAGTKYQGVFRSDDHGETWKPINDGLPFLGDEDDEPRTYSRLTRIIVPSSGTVIAMMPLRGTYTSTDRGETWHDVTDPWFRGGAVSSMTEFDGYLWGASSTGAMLRSLDNGQTWEYIRRFGHGQVTDWAVLNDRLYVAGEKGFARWNEAQGVWEYRTEGLPTHSDGYLDYPPSLTSLAVNRGRLFAGLYGYGVYMFDTHQQTWIPAGLQEFRVTALVSHQSDLFAATVGDPKGRKAPTTRPEASTALQSRPSNPTPKPPPLGQP